MNDKEGKNIFTDDFINQFLVALQKIEEDGESKVLILRGLLDVFCGGADLETLKKLSQGEMAVKDLLLSEKLLNFPLPVISACEGHAMGGGLVLALVSDIVIFSQQSRYGIVFMNMGFTPGMGTTTLLQEMVGAFIANEMMFTGKRFKGKELIDKGTNINYILPKDKVMDKAKDIAMQIAEKISKPLNY